MCDIIVVTFIVNVMHGCMDAWIHVGTVYTGLDSSRLIMAWIHGSMHGIMEWY